MTPSLRDLEAAALSTWPAAEVESLGDWQLRAAEGFTGRANSAQVGVGGWPADLGDRLARVAEFYAERELPPLLQVPLTHGGLLARNVDGAPAACGVGTVRGGLFGLAAMATLPTERGRGHARRIVGALSAWASGHSATTCWLQVAPDNVAALRLYGSLGLRRSYGYVYAELAS